MAKDRFNVVITGHSEEIPNRQWTEEDMLISHAIVLHFVSGLAKKDVAKRLNVSPSKVTGLIEKAYRRRLVETYVNLPANRTLCSQLLELFHPQVQQPRAIAVKEAPAGTDPLLPIGIVASRYFELTARSGISIAMDGGQSVAAMIDALRPRYFDRLRLFPVAGGPPYSPYSSPYALIGRFHGRYGPEAGLEPFYLPAPPKSGLQSAAAKPGAQEVLQAAAEADFFILGIGSLHPAPTKTMADILGYMGVEAESLRAQGAIGTCGYSCFDDQGRQIETELDQMVFKLAPQVFQKAARKRGRRVMLIAAGLEKALCVKALISAGWCNTLVTDQPTAEAILELSEEQQG